MAILKVMNTSHSLHDKFVNSLSEHYNVVHHSFDSHLVKRSVHNKNVSTGRYVPSRNKRSTSTSISKKTQPIKSK